MGIGEHIKSDGRTLIVTWDDSPVLPVLPQRERGFGFHVLYVGQEEYVGRRSSQWREGRE